jgi:anti-sigma-K factor RskA
MTEFDLVSDPRHCDADAAAYALRALDSDEAERYRRHVSGCVVCRDEVATLQAIVEALPMAAPQLRAPRRLKRQTLSRVDAESKVTARVHRRRWLRLRMTRAALIPCSTRGRLVTGGLLAAAAVFVGALEIVPGSPSAVRTVPTAVISEGQFASAVLHLSSGHAELIVSHMPPPPNGKIYQVWLTYPGKAPQPTGALFSVTSAGTGTVEVPGNLGGVNEVMVTPEPLGGSLAPTHAPVIVAALAS